MARQLDELTRRTKRDKVRGMVERAIKDRKLVPAQREQFARIGMRDPKELRALLETMPARVRGEEDAIRESNGPLGGLPASSQETEIMRKAGVGDLYEQARKNGVQLLTLTDFMTGPEN
jgi:hypothetical protein